MIIWQMISITTDLCMRKAIIQMSFGITIFRYYEEIHVL